MNLSEKIITEIEKRKIKQSDLARLIGVDSTVNFHIISDWFNHNKTDRNVRKTVKIMAG